MDPVTQIEEKIARRQRHSVARALLDSFRKLDPRTMIKNPVMFVVEVGALLTTVQLGVECCAPRRTVRLWIADHAVAVVYGAVRQFRGSHGRRPRQGAGRHVAQIARGNRGASLASRWQHRDGGQFEAALWRCRRGRRRRVHSRATAKSSKAWHRWTNPRSPENPRRSFANPAETARRLPAARAFFPMRSKCASRRIPAKLFWTA